VSGVGCVLQCVAVRCGVLSCVSGQDLDVGVGCKVSATFCNTLQYTATYCNWVRIRVWVQGLRVGVWVWRKRVGCW